MAIVGIGHDIIEIERIKNSIEKFGNHFLNRIYTESEIKYCEGKKKNSYESYAARFAAKEAFSKAMGTGTGEFFSWQDIEVRNSNLNKPELILSEKLKKLFPQTIKKYISLSHSQSHASAFIVLED